MSTPSFFKPKPFLIAELGSSHLGDLKNCQEAIDRLSKAGFHAIKFQCVIADELLPKNSKGNSSVAVEGRQIDLYREFKSQEQPLVFYEQLAQRAKARGLQFFCSYFGTQSLGYYPSIASHSKFAAVKIASAETHHLQMWEQLRSLKSQMHIISFGMGDEQEMDWLASYLCQWLMPTKQCWLHCVTRYPAQPEMYDLFSAFTMAKKYRVPVGISDHTQDFFLSACFGALAGALSREMVVEKHVSASSEKHLDSDVAIDLSVAEAFVRSCHRGYEYGRRNPLPFLRHVLGDSHHGGGKQGGEKIGEDRRKSPTPHFPINRKPGNDDLQSDLSNDTKKGNLSAVATAAFLPEEAMREWYEGVLLEETQQWVFQLSKHLDIPHSKLQGIFGSSRIKPDKSVLVHKHKTMRSLHASRDIEKDSLIDLGRVSFLRSAGEEVGRDYRSLHALMEWAKSNIKASVAEKDIAKSDIAKSDVDKSDTAATSSEAEGGVKGGVKGSDAGVAPKENFGEKSTEKSSTKAPVAKSNRKVFGENTSMQLLATCHISQGSPINASNSVWVSNL